MSLHAPASMTDTLSRSCFTVKKKAKLKVKSYAILTKQYLILPNYLFSIKNHYAYKIYLHVGRCSIACGYSIICKLFKCYAYSIESKRGKIVHEW
jgi:hypothetical protein